MDPERVFEGASYAGGKGRIRTVIEINDHGGNRVVTYSVKTTPGEKYGAYGCAKLKKFVKWVVHEVDKDGVRLVTIPLGEYNDLCDLRLKMNLAKKITSLGGQG